MGQQLTVTYFSMRLSTATSMAMGLVARSGRLRKFGVCGLVSLMPRHTTKPSRPYVSFYSKMPLLRTQYAGRLQPAMVQVSQRRTPFYVRYASTDADRSIEPAPKAQSSDPPAAQAGDSGMIRKEGPSEGMTSHHPDWHTPVDHGTS